MLEECKLKEMDKNWQTSKLQNWKMHQILVILHIQRLFVDKAKLIVNVSKFEYEEVSTLENWNTELQCDRPSDFVE